jgi:hypothetical protein
VPCLQPRSVAVRESAVRILLEESGISKPSHCVSASGDEPKMKELDGPATASGGVASSSAETAGQALS